MDFDYYQIKGKWNAANVTRRAEKLEEAEAAADELEAAGADGIEIVGIKAGKRETLRGKREKKPSKSKTPAKKKKAYTPPKMTRKPKKKTSSKKKNLDVVNSIFSHDGRIKILSTDTANKWRFNKKEIDLIVKSMYDAYAVSGKRLGVDGLNVLTVFEKAQNTTNNVDFNLSRKEIDIIFKALQNYQNKQKDGAPIYYEISKLKETIKRFV